MALFRFFFLLCLSTHLLSFKASGQSQASKDSVIFLEIDKINEQAFKIHLSNPSEALILGYEAIGKSKEIGYQRGYAEGLRQVGVVAWVQGNYSSAQQNFLDALRIAEQIKNDQLIADLNGNLGLVSFAIGKYEDAHRFHQTSLILQRKLRNRIREAVALNNLGDVFRKSKRFDDAINHYEEAYRLRKLDGNIGGMATNIRNIGNVYEDRGEVNKALAQYQRSIVLADSINDKRGMAQCRLSMASAYRELKNYSSAKAYALQSLSIAQEAKFKTMVRDSYEMLSKIYSDIGDYKKSLEHYKNFTVYRDSVLNLQVSGEMSSVQLRYDTEKKQAEIDLLKKETEIHQVSMRQQETLMVFGAITLILMTGLAFVIFRNYLRQRDSNVALAQKNHEIAEQHLQIGRQRDELISLNEEITAQREVLVASRDALEERNAAIAKMNEHITHINTNLEKLVRERTDALEKQNQQLKEYAFINAHKLRAPIARILGLANLLTVDLPADDQKKILSLLNDCAVDLDKITRSINEIIQDGLKAHKE